jgi:glycosyltransferase involved in cell wall biosynthesis
MTGLPLVTVVTPVFNGERTLQRCFDSVRAQDYPLIEHVVVDGGSRDGTAALIERAAAGAGEGRELRATSERDAGVYDAMSKGVRQARGEYVHILNADDRYADRGVLSRTIAAMHARALDLHHARARQVDADGRTVCEFGRDVDFAALLKKMRVAHPTVVVRRAVYERFGAFSIGFRVAADHEFLLRVWRKLAIGFTPEVQVLMEIGGISTTNGNVVRAYRESMGAAVIHGRNPWVAAARCGYEIVKHRIIRARAYRPAEPQAAAPSITSVAPATPLLPS